MTTRAGVHEAADTGHVGSAPAMRSGRTGVDGY